MSIKIIKNKSTMYLQKGYYVDISYSHGDADVFQNKTIFLGNDKNTLLTHYLASSLEFNWTGCNIKNICNILENIFNIGYITELKDFIDLELYNRYFKSFENIPVGEFPVIENEIKTNIINSFSNFYCNDLFQIHIPDCFNEGTTRGTGTKYCSILKINYYRINKKGKKNNIEFKTKR